MLMLMFSVVQMSQYMMFTQVHWQLELSSYAVCVAKTTYHSENFSFDFF